MSVIKILMMIVSLTLLPAAVGTLFWTLEEKGGRLPFFWVAGQILIWAGFQCICVPLILLRKSFQQMRDAFFLYVGALLLLSIVVALVRRRKRRGEKTVRKAAEKSRVCRGLWGVFALLLAIQLFLLCFLSYEEGDDAYYVAIANTGREAGQMYSRNPYTGGTTSMDTRHALAPFPMWVSVVSEIAGLSGAATAHVALPLVLVPMAYCLYYLIGKKVLKKAEQGGDWQLPLYMCFVALLIIFGGYSVFSAENFLLVRSAQGKAVLANLVIPFLIYQMLFLLEKSDRGEKTGFCFWVLTGAAMIAGCLCSTMGSLLLCILLGASAFCTGVTYRRWLPVAGAGACMLIPVIFAYFYVIL